MNILPLIFAFLLIFGGISLSFLRDMKGFMILETSSEGHHRTQRIVNNGLAQRAYRKIKADSVKSGTTSEKKEVQKFQSRRSFFPPFENAKLNLLPLFEYESDFKLHPLYHHIAEFLRLLYQNRVFAKCDLENIEYLLLDAILEKGRHLKNVTNLAQLAPDEPKLYAIYYKLLKGTNNYDEEKGIPPLGDFFSLINKAPIICFSFASPPLLEALFGKNIKEKILKKEFESWSKEKQYTYFSKENLNELIAQSPYGLTFSNLEPFLDYSKEFIPRTTYGGKDKITHIVVIKNLK